VTLVSCRQVSVVHGSGERAVTALDHVDLDVEEGARVAFRGRSGSGKTTLLHVIAGLVEPSSGTVERAADARLAVVFQAANLLPHFTAFENVAFAADVARGQGARPVPAEELLELVGLGEKLDNLPGELSGGEAQRVAIARALGTAPTLLLCDEPTGHLDSDTQSRVLELLDLLQREFHFALVVATHDPEVAARFDTIVELHDGRVVAGAGVV
jgi:putative ABC transport system ATP-binding protein